MDSGLLVRKSANIRQPSTWKHFARNDEWTCLQEFKLPFLPCSYFFLSDFCSSLFSSLLSVILFPFMSSARRLVFSPSVVSATSVSYRHTTFFVVLVTTLPCRRCCSHLMPGFLRVISAGISPRICRVLFFSCFSWQRPLVPAAAHRGVLQPGGAEHEQRAGFPPGRHFGGEAIHRSRVLVSSCLPSDKKWTAPRAKSCCSRVLI